MIRTFLVVLLIMKISIAEATESVNLKQESQAITCPMGNGDLFIDERDRYLIFESKKFVTVEFLHEAFLAKAKDGEFGFVHRLKTNEFIFVGGKKIDMKEGHCKQVAASKVCSLGDLVLEWSPTQLKLNDDVYEVKNYGVYPNDGTFFISENVSTQKSIALIDFGNHFSLVVGSFEKMKCSYIKNQ